MVCKGGAAARLATQVLTYFLGFCIRSGLGS